jgi:hypothetical protein
MEEKETSKEMLNRYTALDWVLINEDETHYKMYKNTGTALGHVLIVVFLWWTLGLANLIYWLANKRYKIIMK